MSSQLLKQSAQSGSSEVYVTNDLVVAGAVSGNSFTNSSPGFTETVAFGATANGSYTNTTVPSSGSGKIVVTYNNTGLSAYSGATIQLFVDATNARAPIDLTPLALAGYKFASVSVNSITANTTALATNMSLTLTTWANYPNFGPIYGLNPRASYVWSVFSYPLTTGQSLIGLDSVIATTIPLIKSPGAVASGGNPAIAPAYPSLYLYFDQTATAGLNVSLQFNVTVTGVL